MPADSQFLEKEMPVIRVEEQRVSARTAHFKLKVETPDPCWEYLRHTVAREDDHINVNVIARRDKAAVCIQMIGTFTCDIEVALPAAGTHRVTFGPPDRSISASVECQ